MPGIIFHVEVGSILSVRHLTLTPNGRTTIVDTYMPRG